MPKVKPVEGPGPNMTLVFSKEEILTKSANGIPAMLFDLTDKMEEPTNQASVYSVGDKFIEVVVATANITMDLHTRNVVVINTDIGPTKTPTLFDILYTAMEHEGVDYKDAELEVEVEITVDTQAWFREIFVPDEDAA